MVDYDGGGTPILNIFYSPLKDPYGTVGLSSLKEAPMEGLFL
jgi:hypothetical protein